MQNLNVAADVVTQNWPTPNSNPEAPNNSKMRENGREAERATDQCLSTRALSHSSLPAPEQLNSGKTCWCGALNCGQPSHRRKLNPLFVTWMMGWPLWWTAPVPISYARAEMESYLSSQRSRLRFLVGDLR